MLSVLRNFLTHILRPTGAELLPPATADEEALFTAYRHRTLAELHRSLCLAGAGLVAVFWVLDPFVLPPAAVWPFALMRTALIAYALGGFYLGVRVMPVTRRPVLVVSAVLVGFNMLLARFLAPFGLSGLQHLIPMPLLAVALLIPLRERIYLSLATFVATWVVVLWVLRGLPEGALGTLVTASGAALASVVFGEWLHGVVRLNHISQHRLDALRAGLEERVAQQSQDLRNLAHELVVARDTERRWLSQELHDALGQDLTALRHAGDLSVSLLRLGKVDEAEDAVEDVGTLVTRTHRTLRRILARMRPEAVEQLGLVEGVRGLVAEVERGGIQSRFDPGPEPLDGLSPTVVDMLYRVVQEALTNVVRHAQARSVAVTLSLSDRDVTVRVADDGVGLPAAAQAGVYHVGLTCIRERAVALGGRASWRSAPGEGLEMTVVVPLSAPAL